MAIRWCARSSIAPAGPPISTCGGVRLIDALMEPTTLYVKPVLELLSLHEDRMPWRTSPAAA